MELQLGEEGGKQLVDPPHIQKWSRGCNLAKSAVVTCVSDAHKPRLCNLVPPQSCLWHSLCCPTVHTSNPENEGEILNLGGGEELFEHWGLAH